MGKLNIIRRLKRIEGQVRGIQKMIKENRNTIEVLYQINGVQSANDSVAVAILQNGAFNVLKSNIKTENENKEIQELIQVMTFQIKNSSN